MTLPPWMIPLDDAKNPVAHTSRRRGRRRRCVAEVAAGVFEQQSRETEWIWLSVVGRVGASVGFAGQGQSAGRVVQQSKNRSVVVANEQQTNDWSNLKIKGESTTRWLLTEEGRGREGNKPKGTRSAQNGSLGRWLDDPGEGDDRPAGVGCVARNWAVVFSQGRQGQATGTWEKCTRPSLCPLWPRSGQCWRAQRRLCSRLRQRQPIRDGEPAGAERVDARLSYPPRVLLRRGYTMS